MTTRVMEMMRIYIKAILIPFDLRHDRGFRAHVYVPESHRAGSLGVDAVWTESMYTVGGAGGRDVRVSSVGACLLAFTRGDDG